MAAKSGKTTTIKSGGSKPPVTFQKGALHRQLGVPEGQPIPAAKMAEAKAGKHGPLAQKRARFADGMLKAGRKTAAKNRSKAKS